MTISVILNPDILRLCTVLFSCVTCSTRLTTRFTTGLNSSMQEQVQIDLLQEKSFMNGYNVAGDPFCIVIARRHIPHDAAATRRYIEYCLDAGIRLGQLRGEEWGGKMSGIFDLAGG